MLTLTDLDALLQCEILPAASVNVVSAGRQRSLDEFGREADMPRGHTWVADPERLFSRYNGGDTLVLNRVHRSVPSTGAFCRSLTRECGFKVSANVYITPPLGQGFKRHGDGHDVIVLQLAGMKQWTLFTPDPVRLDLEPGDLLYLPRMLEHMAVCADSPSVHLSVGLNDIYGFDLLAELATAAKLHPAFQSPVPGALSSDEERRAYTTTFQDMVAQLTHEVDATALMARRSLETSRDQWAGWPRRLSDTLELPAIELETIVTRRPDIMVEVSRDERNLTVRCRTAEAVIPVFLSATVDRLLSGESIAVRDLPGLLVDADRLSLVRTLVKHGILTIVRL